MSYQVKSAFELIKHFKTTLNYRSRSKTTLNYRSRRGTTIQSVPVAEAAGEIHFRTILLWHSQGRRKGDPKHKCCGKKLREAQASQFLYLFFFQFQRLGAGAFAHRDATQIMKIQLLAPLLSPSDLETMLETMPILQISAQPSKWLRAVCPEAPSWALES